jgi:hypothetical protein
MTEGPDGTRVLLDERRKHTWLLPGVVLGLFGVLGLVWLIIVVLAGELGSSPPPIWVLTCGILPFSIFWRTGGMWLSEQFDNAKLFVFLKSTLNLVGCDE